MQTTLEFELAVVVPEGTSRKTVAESLNEALNEPPCDWGEWQVGAVRPRRPPRKKDRALRALLTAAREYAEMGRDFPTHGANNLIEQLENLNG